MNNGQLFVYGLLAMTAIGLAIDLWCAVRDAAEK